MRSLSGPGGSGARLKPGTIDLRDRQESVNFCQQALDEHTPEHAAQHAYDAPVTYDLVNERTTSLTRLYNTVAATETNSRRLADVARQSLVGRAKLGSFKEFWEAASNALGDWPKTTRMCVLITVISLNWAFVQWLHWH